MVVVAFSITVRLVQIVNPLPTLIALPAPHVLVTKRGKISAFTIASVESEIVVRVSWPAQCD